MPFQYTFRSDDITTWDVDTRDLLENRDRELELYSTNLEKSTIPIGAITLWAGDTTALPTGYVLCDGAGYSNASTYLALFNVIGYKYGGSAGTFNVPSFSAGNIPFGTTALNADASRNAITVSTSNFASTGHAHIFATVNSGGRSISHQHLTTAWNTSGENSHYHAQNAVNTGNVSADHTHNFSVNSGNDSVNHYHSYLKPGSGAVAAQTGGIDNSHQHSVSGGTSGITANHFHTTNATNTGNAAIEHQHTIPARNTGGDDVTHSHQVTPSVNATTTDTAHPHTVAGNYVVFIIKYL